MAWTNSTCDYFIIWPSSVILTFNLPEKMFQMALLLLKDNNSVKLFRNQWINVQVMALTSSIYDHFIIWSSSVIFSFNLSHQIFQNGTSTPQGEQLCQTVLEIMARTNSIYDPFKCDLDLQPTWKKMFQMALLLLKDNNWAKLFWNSYINVKAMSQTNPDGSTHAITHTLMN